MRKHLWIAVVLLSIHFSFGQVPWHSTYHFTDKVLEQLAQDSLLSDASERMSYVGEYEQALAIWDLKQRKSPADLTPEQSQAFSKFRPVRAKEFILEKAKTEQIIIINEAHHQPYHRVFTTSLLHDLYKAGFRYFGAETISNHAPALHEMVTNQFPTFRSGYYSSEPFYGNLIREAMHEGFEIFAYETTRTGNSDSADINLREIDQARNIKKILDKDPKAKILIHCGWDHIVEAPYPGWGKAMAGRLFEYTGINPYTIDQTKLTEHASAAYQNPYWRAIHLDYHALFVDTAGQAFYGPQENKQYDARLYHPKTKWWHGRPHWVFENNRVPFLIKEKITVQYPCLVFAYLAKEWSANENAIPFDVIEIKSPSDQKALSLRRGQPFTIIIRDQKRLEQKMEVMVD